jgi:hypothetical protein
MANQVNSHAGLRVAVGEQFLGTSESCRKGHMSCGLKVEKHSHYGVEESGE